MSFTPDFTAAATRLAGWLLHWPPEDFWRATPAELAAIFAAMTGVGAGIGEIAPPDRTSLDRLKEMFPDG